MHQVQEVVSLRYNPFNMLVGRTLDMTRRRSISKVYLQVIGLECNDRSKFNTVFKAAQANKLNIEILPTEHACATFNFLNAEGR